MKINYFLLAIVLVELAMVGALRYSLGSWKNVSECLSAPTNTNCKGD